MGDATALDPAVSQVVVDTSAFYRLSLAELEAVAERAAVLVSPISLCDILIHLDDPRHGNEGGERGEPVRRSRLCKCDLLQTLCDPLAERPPFAGLSRSLDDLRGGAGRAAAAADRVRSALDEARRAHVRQVLDFCQDLVAQLGVERALSLSGPDFVRFALESVKALAEACRELGADAPALEGAVLSSVYPFAGYRLASAQDRLRRTRVGRGPAPDPDDMEDAHLCLHLDLLEPRALVTADPGTRSALERALAELAGASAEVGAEVVALSRAMSVDEVVRAFPRTGRA
jgi:hypothetical protein